mmetsp:Transcript_30551/g.51436  ORF Transcript_30551/g.51436 Transcript_30551/m.51436 type:complete len:162 (-) Transcript_30551:407-892(-)
MLKNLMFLDMQYNKIEHIDEAEIPESVQIASFVGNIDTDYRERLVSHLPNLEELDGITVDPQSPNDDQDSPRDSARESQVSERLQQGDLGEKISQCATEFESAVVQLHTARENMLQRSKLRIDETRQSHSDRLKLLQGSQTQLADIVRKSREIRLTKPAWI